MHHFAEWGNQWDWIVDPNTGMWIPRTSEPGKQGQHRGVDFDCPRGTVIDAMANGMIVKARQDSAIDRKAGCGLYIIQLVEMPGFDAWWIRYTHLNEIYHKVGSLVKRGQAIAETGDSGETDFPKLHVDLMDTKHQYHPIQWV